MTVEKEEKVIYKIIEATKEEQAFCKQLLELVPNVIVDEAVADYYKNHEDELLNGFLDDIATCGYIDLSEYE